MGIVLGAIAPHPPHLVYAENPPQNEPHAECGWETLRWGYESLRKKLEKVEYDSIVVFSPHWQTYVGTHFLGVPHFRSKSVDPIFPNLFRFHYELDVDVKLARAIHDHAANAGMQVKMMENPDFRVDYGTIVSCHLTNPDWDKPIVSISSQRAAAYFNMEYMHEVAIQLGEATKKAIDDSGKKVILLASCSLSHRHFVSEPSIPEDMSYEHITNYNQYLWDMQMIDLFKAGKTREVMQIMTDFTEQATAETDSGALSWLLSAMEYPGEPAEIHGYGTVIGTGNAVVSWEGSVS